jgi:hypothetical protein
LLLKLKDLLMNRNMLNLFFVMSILACSTPATAYGLAEETLINSGLAVMNDNKITDNKLTQDLDKLIALLQKSSQSTLENKAAATCSALGLGGLAGLFVGSTYRLSQRKTVTNPWFGEHIDMSDFVSSTAKVGVPVGLVVAGLSFLVLKKIIEPKNSSSLNSFAQKLNDFKSELSRNETLTEINQIKLEKIITLLTHVFEKSSANSTATIIKKIVAMLSGGVISGTSSFTSYLGFALIFAQLNETLKDHFNYDEDLLIQLPLAHALPAFLAGAGLTSLVANKILEPELLNLEGIEQASINALYDFLPNKASVA